MSLAVGVALGLLCTAARARAYTISSPISLGCHERITAEALRTVRAELPTAPALPLSADERALVSDLTFHVPDDLDDLGGSALLIAVRDNDLKGRHSVDLAHLALVHGDPSGQREHCLRSPGQIGSEGDEAAVNACRAFIRERIEQALDALDEAGRPDPEKRVELPVYLALRHRVQAPLPAFYVLMGQALHTIEDSFTHTFRSADGMRIRAVGNWLDSVDGKTNEARNGPAHRGELDQCDHLDDLRQARKELATRAATEALRSALDPALTRAQKLQELDAFLERYLGYEPGCTYDNDWCDAPERKYGSGDAVKCALAAPHQDAGLLALLALLALGVKRRRARSLERSLLLAWLGLCTLPGSAAAEATKAGQGLLGSERENDARRKGTDADDERLLLGGYLGVAGAVDHGAGVVALGARLRFRKNWIFGLDAEWNPWISDPRVIYNADHFRAGVFNGYGTCIFRLPLANEAFNLRMTLSVGFSTMLMDLYGAPRGSTGLFAAFTPLGLEWKMASIPYLIINPLSIALPAPQLNGVPFVYAQYRFTIGVELYAKEPPRGLRGK